MTVAGDIVANLTVNSKGWSSGLKDAITPLSAFSTAVLGMSAAGVYKFNEIGSAIDDMSQRTGVSAETLGGLSYAAQQTDTSMESLQAGLVKQSKFMESLDAGSSSAAATLNKLGISADDLAGKTADERFLIFADRLSKIENVSQRSAAAMDVFGKGAVDLIPLLSQGGDGIQGMIDRAEKLGLIMSNEDVKAAADFGDSLDELTLAGEMFLIKVVSPLVPMLTDAAVFITNLVAENREWIVVMTQAAGVIGIAIAGIKAVNLASQAYTKSLVIMQAMSGPKGWAILAAGAAVAAGALYALDVKQQGINLTLENGTQSNKSHVASIHEQIAARQKLIRNLEDADRVQTRLNRQLMTPAEQAIADAHQLADEWWKASRAGSQLGMRFEDLKRLQTKTLEDKSGFSGMFTDITDELRILRGEITETELKFEQMAEFGVSDKQIQKLREANAERDKLLAEQQAKKDEESAASNRISNIQKTVRDSFGTPLDDFIEKAKGVEEAIKAGALTKAEGTAYLEAERKKLLEDTAKELETPEQRKAAITEAISVNSDSANRMVVDLMNRKGGGQTLDEKQLSLQQQQKKLEEQSLEVLQTIAGNTGKPQLATKPFRAGA